MNKDQYNILDLSANPALRESLNKMSMKRPNFPVPRETSALLKALNTYAGSISYVEASGAVYGAITVCDGITQVEPSNSYTIYDGDQIMYQTTSREEALAFLYGCCLIAFNGDYNFTP